MTIRLNSPEPTMEALLAAARPHAHDADAVEAKLCKVRGEETPRILELYARAYLALGAHFPSVRIALGQALIDLGRHTEALDYLHALEFELRSSGQKGKAHAEAGGLIARAFKQLYIDARPTPSEPREADLERAIIYYERTYYEDTYANYWHGGNVMALLARAARVHGAGAPGRAVYIAEALLQDLEEARRRDTGPLTWRLGTCVEAAYVTGRHDQCVELVREFLRSADPFMQLSLHRQCCELWGMDEDGGTGAVVLTLIEHAMARGTGAVGLRDARAHLELSVPAAVQRVDAARAVLGGDDLRDLAWYRTALERARSVVRLRPVHGGDGVGTGVLIAGDAVHPTLAGRTLVLTCAHVATDDRRDERVRDAAHPCSLAVNFAGAPGSETAGVEGLVAVDLDRDVSLLALDRPVAIEALAVEAVELGTLVNVIGYCKGRSLRTAFRNNAVLGRRGDMFDHGADTADGMSGSPLFDDEWRWVGVHCGAARGTNVGVWLPAALRALRADVEARRTRGA